MHLNKFIYTCARTHAQQMISLYCDPLGEKVLSKSVASQSSHATGRLDSNDRTIESLQNKVKQLEVALSKCESSQNFNAEPPSTKISKVSFTQDENGDIIEEHLPSNGITINTTKVGNEYATSEL